jgi:pyruvate,water dikinase
MLSVRDSGLIVLRGKAAGRGIHIGIARVRTRANTTDIADADVLVCKTLTAASATATRIGAIVTDAGGILSNAAIVAREAGIPTVVATRGATQLIRDGQRVAVDGSRGVVWVLADGPAV